MTSNYHLLVVDDDPQMQFFLKEALERQQYLVRVQGSAEEALDTLKDETFDLILMDVHLPGITGLEAVEEIQKADRQTPIIIMTAHGTRDSALDAVRRGAYDYFTKPFSLDELEIIVRRALEKRRLLAELDRLSQELANRRRRRLVGESRAMEEVVRLIDRVGPTDSTMLQNLTLDEKVAHIERAFVVDALARAGGVQAAAARLLGVTERSVWHLVKKHRIEVSRLKQRVG